MNPETGIFLLQFLQELLFPEAVGTALAPEEIEIYRFFPSGRMVGGQPGGDPQQKQ
jgi:hypothetical protein